MVNRKALGSIFGGRLSRSMILRSFLELAHGFLIKFDMGIREVSSAYDNHRKYNFLKRGSS